MSSRRSPRRLRLLGGWRIQVGESCRDVPGATDRALLLMLARARDDGVHARTLIEGGWGRSWQLADAADSLHHAIARLRRLLDDDDHTVIVNYSRYWYRLNLSPGDRVDVTDFLEDFTRARRLLGAGRDRSPEVERHAMCHQVAGLRLWGIGSAAAALPPDTHPDAIRLGAERLDAQRRELLAAYGPLAGRYGPLPGIPVHQLVPDMVRHDVSVSPGLLRDLLRDSTALDRDDLIRALGRLCDSHPHARRLVTEVLLAGTDDAT